MNMKSRLAEKKGKKGGGGGGKLVKNRPCSREMEC